MTVKNNDFLDVANNRRSIRQFDPTVKISKEEMTEMLELAIKAPSSLNLQPWKFIVIESDEVKASVSEAFGFNKNQLETCSAMIAVLGDLRSFDNAEDILNMAVESGKMTAEAKEKRLARYAEYEENLTPVSAQSRMLVDGGLITMQLTNIAYAFGYGTCVIGGYDKAKAMENLGIDSNRYVPVVMVSIGKPAEPAGKASRLPVERFVEWR